MSQNHYQTLGVLPSAPAADIKRAYRQLATRYHPDKHGGDPRYEEQFKAVAQAYRVLSDPDRRAQYDFRLQQAARQAAERRRAAQRPAGAGSGPTGPAAADPRMYGTAGQPAPGGAPPLRTRRPAGARERHYQRIPRQNVRFTRQDFLVSAGLLLLIVLFSVSVKVVMDRVTGADRYEQARTAAAAGHHALALDLLSEALLMRPDYAPALALRGQLSQDVAHDLPAAIADYDAALRSDDAPLVPPAQPQVLFRLGQCQAALRQPGAAERSFGRALTLDTTLTVAYLARGENRLLGLHQPTEALADLHHGHRQCQQAHAPMPPYYLQAEGAALARLGRYPEARQVYEAALVADPRDGRTLYLLGRLAQQVGDSAGGCAFFRRGAAAGHAEAGRAAASCR